MALTILIFHNIENFAATRENISDYLFSFQRHAPHNNYLYHRITLPVTQTLQDTEFDAIIFDSSALGMVTARPPSLFQDIKQNLSFIAQRKAVKIFLPQDDYSHSAILDDFFVSLGADVIVTCLIDHSELFYPRAGTRCDFVAGMTGYVEDSCIEARQGYAKPFAERSRLIGQRTSFYPPRGGRFAQAKGRMAEFIRDEAEARGLKVDISTRDEDVFLDVEWFKFMGDCKFFLGSESGTSIHDPDGGIYDSTAAHMAAHPDASFEGVEAACFPGVDGKHIFTALSPRTFEAAVMGCCQILLEGSYSGILRPYEHYIPLKQDYSNIDEVFALMRDEGETERRIAATYKALIENPEFRYSTFVNRLLSYVVDKLRERGHKPRAAGDFESLKVLHLRQLIGEMAKREREVGFVGRELIERVGDVIACQYADPAISSDGSAGSTKIYCREIAELRTEIFWLEQLGLETDGQIQDLQAKLLGQIQGLQDLQAKLCWVRSKLEATETELALVRQSWPFRVYDRTRRAFRRVVSPLAGRSLE